MQILIYYLHILLILCVQILRTILQILRMQKGGLLQRMCFQNHEKGGMVKGE